MTAGYGLPADPLAVPAVVARPARVRALRRVAARGSAAWRAEPVARKIAYARRCGVGLEPDAAPEDVDRVLEQLLGLADVLPGHWLRTGHEVSDAVALVRTPRGTATGVLVSPWLLLTVEPVLRHGDDAEQAVLQLRYQRDARGRTGAAREHRLDPERFFDADAVHGWALAALRGPDAHAGPGHAYAPVPMQGASGTILLGQPVTVVQHRRGRPRELTVRASRLIGVTGTALTYGPVDGAGPGSAGAPVFTDRWDLVGLHHRPVEAADGHPIAHEAVRVSVVVADLAARTYPAARAALLDHAGILPTLPGRTG